MVSIALRKEFAAKNGTARWEIPVSVIEFPEEEADAVFGISTQDDVPIEDQIKTSKGQIVREVSIVQEFVLENYNLTLRKGGVSLGAVNLLEVDRGFRQKNKCPCVCILL